MTRVAQAAGEPPAVARRPARVVATEVCRVTLLEDRARVLRVGSVALEAGPVTLEVQGVAPVLVDRSVAVRITGPGAVSVVDVRVRRVRTVTTPQLPEALRAFETQRRDLESGIARQRAWIDGLGREQMAMMRLCKQTLADVAEDAASARGSGPEWTDHFRPIEERFTDLAREVCRRTSDTAELEERLRDLERRIQALKTPAASGRCSIEVDADAAADGEVRLEIEYTVPGACWRPAHTARLVGSKLSFACDGCVWQNTGEDWTDVEVRFSTERPSLGAGPPVLHDDVLQVQAKQPVTVVQRREQEVHTAGLGSVAKEWPSSPPGIDDGGEPRTLDGLTRATVPSDGRPYRVPLFSFEATSTHARVLLGQVAAAVVERTEHANTAPLPVLAGPVELIRENGFVGRSSVLYVAPGERFALGWGADACIGVHREETERVEERSLLGALSPWTSTDHRVTVHLSNTADEERVVTVTERVPVSEVEKVQVVHDATQTTDGRRPDADGFVQWPVVLPAFGRTTVRLRYQMRRHDDVLEA